MKTPNTPQWKLRRLAGRTVRVHARQREKDPALGAFDSTSATASEFITVYDRLRNLAKLRMQERREGKEAISELVDRLRVWAPRVERDVEEVVSSEYGENPGVPDDVLNDAKVLIDHVTAYADRAGEPLAYAEALQTDLGGALATAEAEWAEAEQAQEGFAELRKTLHAIGLALEQDLVVYRRSLRQVIGATHPDYQKLRTERIRLVDEDDDAVAAALPEGLEPKAPAAPPATDEPVAEVPAAE